MIRRILTVLVFLSVAGVAAACGQASTGTTSSSTTGSAASASPSPSTDVKANTTKVCGSANKVVTQESGKELGVQVGLMIAARKNHKTAEETAAKTKIQTMTDDWAKQLRDLGATAADPALTTAVNQAAEGLAVLGSDTYLAKINTLADVPKIETDLARAGAALAKICP